MKRFKGLLEISFAGILLVHCVFAQDKQSNVQFKKDVSNVGTSAATFLEIGVGARAMAMGGAYTSVTKDATALYWNSAGIARVDGIQLELMHIEWIAETSYDFIGIVVPVPAIRSSIGFSIIYLDYGSDLVRTVDRPEGTGEEFIAQDMAVSFSFARALTDRFSFGITAKSVTQQIWNEKGSAAALDFGVLYLNLVQGLNLGVNLSNFGNDIRLYGRDLRRTIDPDERVANFDRVPVNYNTGSYPLPLMFSVGISYEKALRSFGKVLLAMNLNHPSNATESINLGAEYGFRNLFYIRGGYENMFELDRTNGLTLGGGINIPKLGGIGVRIDYAWSDWGILNSVQRFSVSFY
ncbi:MAG: PorV/PorQ family protein [Candidatus Marinimicrobia bacterium]|nr:PorV/PorQ family protein [Candidatus Neomarinimicrobiota bacterium]